MSDGVPKVNPRLALMGEAFLQDTEWRQLTGKRIAATCDWLLPAGELDFEEPDMDITVGDVNRRIAQAKGKHDEEAVKDRLNTLMELAIRPPAILNNPKTLVANTASKL